MSPLSPAAPANVQPLFDPHRPNRVLLEDAGGVRIAVVVHPNGHRDIEFLTLDDDEPAAVLSFTEDQARVIAQLLEG